MKARLKRRAKAKARRKSSFPVADEPGAFSRALFGLDEDQRTAPEPKDDRSVEDPLLDWPDEEDGASELIMMGLGERRHGGL